MNFLLSYLVGVGFLSFTLGQIVDGIAILGIAAVETVLSTLQQHKAEKSLYSLKEMMVRNATVIRNGKRCVIDAKYVVPGDVIIIEAGEKVPADARIIEYNELKASEAVFTGESKPVCKSCEICDENEELANRYNMIYMGTNMLSGRCKAIVVATGLNTEIGKIAYMLQNIKNESAPIEKKIKKFTDKITKIAFGICMGVSDLGLLSGLSLIQVFILGVSFAIGAIPESLPAVVTAAMSLSVEKMASLSLQILWTDVVSESILGASLTFEKPSNDIMKNPPISKDYEIIDKELRRKILRTGVITGLTTFGIFKGSLLFVVSLQKARTLAFTNLVLSQILSVYDCKTNRKSKNKYMNISAIACVAMFGGMLYIPFMSSFFLTVPLNIMDILILSGTTTLSRI